MPQGQRRAGDLLVLPLQGQEDRPGVLQAGLRQSADARRRCVVDVLGIVVGQNHIDGGQELFNLAAARDAVAAQKGREAALGKPVVEVGDEILTVHLPPLERHEIVPPAGHDANQNAPDVHARLLEEGIEIVNAVALVEEVVHQQHRAAEGLDGADLIFEGAVARVLLHGEMDDVPVVDLLHVEGLGDGIGHDGVGQNLAVGHAHEAPQTPYAHGDVEHLVVLLHLMEQRLVEGLGVEGQHQRPGEEAGEGAAQLGAALGHSLAHRRVVPVGRLNGKEDVLDEHQGIPHVHIV